MNRISRIFLAGLIAVLPLIITAFAIGWVLGTLNDYLGPASWFGRKLTALGVGLGASSVAPYVIGLLLVLAVIYVLGLLVESRAGPWLAALMDRVMGRIPVVSNVYDLTKRFTSIVDTKKDGGLGSMTPVWCFFGGEPGAAVLALLPSSQAVTIGKDDYVGILVPSAPVPVGGALIYVPRAWVKPAEGGMDELMAVYVSMGVTVPTGSGG